MLGRYLGEKNGKSVEVVGCCYDISLLDSLQALLRMDVVRDQVSNKHGQCTEISCDCYIMYTPYMILGDEFTWINSGMLRDDCDGELFTASELFQDDPNPIVLR